MKKQIIFLLIIILQVSCKNYNSDNYINNENEAIQEIILQLIQYEEVNKLNDFKDKNYKLYLLNTLLTDINPINYPQTEPYSIEGDEKSEEITEEQEKYLEEKMTNYKKEKKKFFPFLIGSINERKLDFTFSNPKLIIEQVSEKDYNSKMSEKSNNVYGFLGMSRIVFNSNFDVGYLSYVVFCGASCGWNENIEIKKINGKWKITQRFSGGIA